MNIFSTIWKWIAEVDFFFSGDIFSKKTCGPMQAWMTDYNDMSDME